MSFWKKRCFHTLNEEDETDMVVAGSQFIVKYVGSTEAREDFCRFEDNEEALAGFYGSLVKTFQNRVFCKLRLVVDLCGAVIYDKLGCCVRRFQLCDIKDIVYCEKTERYRKYFILVGREESDPRIKAYVFICEDKQQAKHIHKMFIQTFTIAREINNSTGTDLEPTSNTTSDHFVERPKTFAYRSTKTVATESSTVKGENNYNGPQLAIFQDKHPSAVVHGGVVVVDPNECMIRANSTDESFTELARSRARPV